MWSLSLNESANWRGLEFNLKIITKIYDEMRCEIPNRIA
jgi:hypothetical protein